MVIAEMLADLCRGREADSRPTKDELLQYLTSRAGKLSLFFMRHLPAEQVIKSRKDPAFQKGLLSELRREIIELKPPLLNPLRVDRLTGVALEYPAGEVRKDPDLWAARVMVELPPELRHKQPLVAMRLLLAEVKDSFERVAATTGSLPELDRAYGFIERELNLTPRVEIFVRRAWDLAPKAADAGAITALYRLLVMRIIATLRELPASNEKDLALGELKKLTGTFDLDELESIFKKKAMTLADEMMKETGRYEDLLELRFFFGQIGERSNRKLLSQKTGELVRKMDMRTRGHRLLTSLDTGELDEDSLIKVVPTVMAKAEMFVMTGPPAFLDLLMDFYLKTAAPLLRELKNKPEKVPRLIQNFKRQVGLLNVYHGLDHLAQTIQRKMVLAICGPKMLASAPEKILRYLTRLPPEFYPDKVMQALRAMIREKGVNARFTTGDALKLLSFYPPAQEEEAEAEKALDPRFAKEFFSLEYKKRGL
ncbi:MAG: hypothetical protein JXQ83_11475 [Candidatus Glassbacteria bacterium]|nr:hypothetical protein [Candidatus Glassbacteria bacterium]